MGQSRQYDIFTLTFESFSGFASILTNAHSYFVAPVFRALHLKVSKLITVMNS